MKVQKVMEELNKVIIGKEDRVKNVVITLLAGGHLLIEDVPGVGKTTLVNALAKCIDGSFGRIQFTPDTLPSDITGLSIYNMSKGEFVYTKGPIINNIVLADEINRTSPKTQASLLEAMEEGQISVDGRIYKIEEPFMVIATQNPIDFLGTYNLPEAQLDRFMMRISMGYPDKKEEAAMALDRMVGAEKLEVKPVITKEELLEIKKEVDKVRVHTDIINYVVDIVNTTRNNENFSLGASPRATLALLRAAKAKAYVEGRQFVIPEDIRELLEPVLCHRLVLSVEAKMKKQTTYEYLRQCVREVNVPVLTGEK